VLEVQWSRALSLMCEVAQVSKVMKKYVKLTKTIATFSWEETTPFT
jgi:hypothetical protein